MDKILASALPWVFVMAIFYVFLMLPEQKKQKKAKEMINNLMVGDKVMTRSGIIGTIQNITDDTIVIESGPSRMKLEMSKYAVNNVIESRAEKFNIKAEQVDKEK